MKKWICTFIFLFSVLLFSPGCKKSETVSSEPSGTDMNALKKKYKLAILDAKYAEPWEISRNLVAIQYYGDSTAGEGNLTWSKDSVGRPRLRVVSWMKQSTLAYWPLGTTFRTSSNPDFMSWITTCPEMLNFLKKSGITDSNAMHLRIAQMLGMPPDTQNNFFVEFWVYPDNLFRPTPDPEITDHEALLYFPAGVTQGYKDWFNSQVAIKYDTSSTAGFPWTRLGYTYDWATPAHPVGLSEFVVDTSALVTVTAVYSSWQYYKYSLTVKDVNALHQK